MVAPSIGRIVHYVSYGTPGGEYTSCCLAAIVTEVLPERKGDAYTVGLAVLNPSGMFFNHSTYDEWDGTRALPGAEPQGGSWHWPERAED